MTGHQTFQGSKKIFLLAGFTFFVICIFMFSVSRNNSLFPGFDLIQQQNPASNENHLVRRFSSLYYTTTQNSKHNACPFLDVDPFDPLVKRHVSQNLRPLNCSKGLPSLVYIDGELLRVNATKVKQTVGMIDYCRYTPIKLSHQNDRSLQALNWSSLFLEEPIKLSSKDEHFHIICYFNDTIVGETFKSRIIEKPELENNFTENYKRHIEENSPLETLSILIVGIDGMSKQNLIRTMPNTRNYIINHLHARELNKFNKVGDNTFPNVLVLLSGQNETDIEPRWNRHTYFDKIDDIFSWHHYQKAGYRTSMVLDVTYITAFHYLKRGWKHPPFDYHTRPLSLKLGKAGKRIRKGGGNCVGEVPELVILQDYLLQLTSKFNNSKNKPYFAYSFFTDLTHSNQNNAARADDIFLNFFRQLDQNKVLNNTVVIFFSDHGTRFGSFRSTLNGKIEVNTPYVFFMFPPWFEKKYPEVMNTFRINQNRLTTFYDINETLMDLLKFTGKTKSGNLNSRAISLFDEIPKERTCSHAAIKVNFCNCRSLSNVPVPKDISRNISQELLKSIVNKTRKHKNICAVLSLKKVHSIVMLEKRKNKNSSVSLYKVVIETKPGGAVFESVLKYDGKSRQTSLLGTIVRINLYKGQDGCVNTLELKPFCFCKLPVISI